MQCKYLCVESITIGCDLEVFDLFDLLTNAVLLSVYQLESLRVHFTFIIAIDDLFLFSAVTLRIGLCRLVFDASFDLSEVLLIFGSDSVYFGHIGIFALL